MAFRNPRSEDCQVTSTLFPTTHWSVLLASGRPDLPEAEEALERLCRTYWTPIYAYIRRRGHSPEDAQDLTQELFARLLAKQRLSRVAPHKGRFRSFLLASVNHLLADARDRATRQKRGGGKPMLSWEAQTAEECYSAVLMHGSTAESLFERRWALALVEQVLNRLEQEHIQVGKPELFTALKEFLTGGKGSRDYPEVARSLDKSEATLRVTVHRLRQRYGQLFREEVASTLTTTEDLDAEMRHLLTVLSE
jgi:RNA polymerase sigma-70 factor (ECF subfamily)